MERNISFKGGVIGTLWSVALQQNIAQERKKTMEQPAQWSGEIPRKVVGFPLYDQLLHKKF